MQQTVAADKLASELNKQYQEGLSYKRRMGFLSKWPEYERMKAGDQWPPSTPQTQNLPRPVFNVIKMIETHKVATVMSEQIKMVFSLQEMSDQEDDGIGDLFSRYSDATWERIKQDELNEEGLDTAANTGTGIWHYYWDSAAKGGKIDPWVGEMQGEVLDPINVFFGNPQQRRVQKQPYIIISSREDVASVKRYAKANGLSKEMVGLIQPDKDTQDQGYDMAKVEVEGTGKVTVLTRYWREDDGRIMFCKVASSLTIKKPTDTQLTLYPIAVMQWERRKKSIFGVGETEGLVPNQKAVNLLIAMQILSVQLTGWPKMLYKSNAIDPWKVTNTPGEMIEDKLPPGQGDGVKYMTPAAMPNTAANLVEAILGYTRQMTGADEAATGAAPSADLNATAIMLLQKAAAIPIESIKRRFYRLIEDVGRIWEDFWKVKYNLPRQVVLKDDDGEEYVKSFNGAAYKDVELNLKIDVGPSSTYSESLVLSSLNEALNRGDITYKQYLNYAPKTVVPYRDRLLKEMESQSGIVGMIEQFMSTLTPEQQAEFNAMPPEQQLALIQQIVIPPAQPGAGPPVDPTAPQPSLPQPGVMPMPVGL